MESRSELILVVVKLSFFVVSPSVLVLLFLLEHLSVLLQLVFFLIDDWAFLWES